MKTWRKQTIRRQLKGKNVPTGTPRSKRVVTYSKRWYGTITLSADKRKQIPLTHDEETSEKLLQQRQQEQDERRVNGITTYDDAKQKTISSVLDEFVPYLKSKENTAEYLLHRHLKDAERVENNAQRRKSLSELTGELRTTPGRGVDIDVVNNWLALVAASERLQANQRQVENGELAVEALLRGLAGDALGTARDVLQRDKVDLDAFSKSFLELKNLTPVLTEKY